MPFSNRTPGDLSPNRIAEAIESSRDQPLFDLTQSNPTLCGFRYPPELLKEFSNPESLRYEPSPFGTLKARKALSHYLANQGQVVAPENLVLTASTSEAYSFLFKLLGNPGDSFLVQTPGYPLLDHLLQLEGLQLTPCPFQIQANWPVDWNQAQASVKPQTKGIITVNPHNPTGTFLSEKDQQTLAVFAEKNRLAHISDEVFADYAYGPQPKTAQNKGILSFRLGGLSKSLGLPQFKLSWIAIDGPTALVGECKDRLELIADTYLSVNTPVQTALPSILAFAPDIQNQILTQVLSNRNCLEKALAGLKNIKVWPAQGGWYALVEVLGKEADDENYVISLIKEHQVLVQPGGFYDFEKKCFLVVSLLPQPDVFNTGTTRLRSFLESLRL